MKKQTTNYNFLLNIKIGNKTQYSPIDSIEVNIAFHGEPGLKQKAPGVIPALKVSMGTPVALNL
jgi:hypothetical protein